MRLTEYSLAILSIDQQRHCRVILVSGSTIIICIDQTIVKTNVVCNGWRKYVMLRL